MKICACINGKNPDECIRVMERTDTEFVEHRMDFMERIERLNDIYASTQAAIIATNRSTANGGNFEGTEEDRLGHLMEAMDAGCQYVDIELETGQKLRVPVMEHAVKLGIGIILSTHNFQCTPGPEELMRLMNELKKQGADIGKIVTYANRPEDCHHILELLVHAKRQDFELVAFAMGGIGRFTRLLAPLYGSPFTYASVTGEVAHGQLSVEDTRRIWRELCLE